MKSLEECVVTALDGSEPEIFPYIPYILQDLWEIGASPDIIIDLIKKHKSDYKNLMVLDLGCGKGAVSVKSALKLQCRCYGIDAVREFIEYADIKAKEFGVESICSFEVGDIRTKIKELNDFDVVILGSIGPVLGNYYQTLMSLSKCTKADGIFVIDEGYIDNYDTFSHPFVLKKDEILRQISKAGMRLHDEVIFNMDENENQDRYILDRLTQRCLELIEIHPDKRKLFESYIRKQEYETELLETKIICSTMVIKRK
ncbi:MAG TPA: class I SAM-dependent methyltransferase [Ignavibacteriaceae bacterium]|nr:class I SAM-dependent methyltransferase [Ignavibacteriaceae bacterium]